MEHQAVIMTTKRWTKVRKTVRDSSSQATSELVDQLVEDHDLYVVDDGPPNGRDLPERAILGPVRLTTRGLQDEAEKFLASAGWETNGLWTGSGNQFQVVYHISVRVRRRVSPPGQEHIVGADNTGKDLQRANLQGQDLTKTTLVRANLARASLQHAKLDGLDLTGVCFDEADLTGASLTGAILTGCMFRRAKACDAILTGAALEGSMMHFINLRNADLRSVALIAVQLELATLSGVDFTGAQLSGSAPGADLTGANLRGVDLSRMDLKRVRLQGANLSDAILPSGGVGEYMLTGIEWDETTEWGSARKDIEARSVRAVKNPGQPQRWTIQRPTSLDSYTPKKEPRRKWWRRRP